MNVDERLAALEARVAKLEGAGGDSETSQPVDPQRLWILEGLRQSLPGDGGVAFAGTVTTGVGLAQYQWTRPTSTLTEHPWDDQLERIAAVAHPVRGAILRHLLDGPATVVDLVEAGVVTSTGTAYHHVAALTAAGWLTKQPGGRLAVPVGRIVPLLTLITCGEDH